MRAGSGNIRRLALRAGALAGALALALACASNDAPPSSQLRFIDSKMWEEDLQRALGEDLPAVTVAFAGTDATVSNLPARLEKWLYVIDKRDDGKVDIQPDMSFQHPDVIPKNIPYGLAFSAAMAGWNMYKNWSHYAPANVYDAIVFYHPYEGYLTRVVFVHKPDDS